MALNPRSTLPVPIISVTSWRILSMLHSTTVNHQTHAGVVRFKQGNFDALILEEALGLSQVKRSVVRRGLPIVD